MPLKINVSYSEKDLAKEKGAFWDKDNKTWFVPDYKDINLFSQWIDTDIEYHNIKSLEGAFVLKNGESNIMDIVVTAYYLSEKSTEAIHDVYIDRLRDDHGDIKKSWLHKLLT